MNIFEEIKKLNFPLGSYVVVGSGHLDALGLKEAHDIDIVVVEELFEKCKDEDWEQVPFTYLDRLGDIFLRKGNVELYLDVNKGKFNPPTADLIKRAVVINNTPFASLEDILSFKKEYSKINPKHLKDITLIENYLKSRHTD